MVMKHEDGDEPNIIELKWWRSHAAQMQQFRRVCFWVNRDAFATMNGLGLGLGGVDGTGCAGGAAGSRRQAMGEQGSCGRDEGWVGAVGGIGSAIRRDN